MRPLAAHGIGNIAPIARRWLDRAAIIATDELPAHLAVGRALAGHVRVNHSADEFARDDLRTGRHAHVNPAESLHALLKRAVIGVWHWISEKHLVRYLAETMVHGNHRGAFENRLHSLFRSGHGPLPLKTLLA